jgi:hypothetical protein
MVELYLHSLMCLHGCLIKRKDNFICACSVFALNHTEFIFTNKKSLMLTEVKCVVAMLNHDVMKMWS